MNEIEELKKDLDLIIAKATEYDKLDHKFKLVCGKRVEQVLQHLCLFGFGDGITEQQALNKLVERFPMTTDQIVSTLEISQAGVTHEPVEVPKFIKNTMQQYNSLQEMLTEEYYSDNTSEKDSDAVFCWIDTNFDLLCRAWLDDYTVAKEPLHWAVLGVTDYFRCDGKIIVFAKEEEAIEAANLIGISTRVEQLNKYDYSDCILIDELRETLEEETK